ncbi:hypothetical protein SKAU_G00429880 [Synaphobranchus kaupii]|uniref:F-box domain-containing protein n=1 Tax=Synaphobranchus kaupii TaxID=118154 RepID=A0A9Q1E4H2_SYNKA|nr:hypothetical protein SKAU_G00429880 [Synaphobranchus kaupii]
MDSCLTNGVAVPIGSIEELSKDLLQKILLEVVHDAGALLTLSLVCRQFRDIVGASVFKRKAHLAWLDSPAVGTLLSPVLLSGGSVHSIPAPEELLVAVDGG